MLKRVRIKNFKSIKDCDVTLGKLTVLVGKNNSGKSNFIDALRFLRDVSKYDLDTAMDDRGGGAAVKKWNTENHFAIHIDLGDLGDFGDLDNAAEHAELNVLIDSDFYERNLGISKRHTDFMTKARFYNIYPETEILRKPQPVLNASPLAENGANFASVLRHIKSASAPRELWLFKHALRMVAEDVSDFSVVEIRKYLFTSLHSEGQTEYDLSAASDGTVRALVILAALYQLPPPPLIIIEEPESGIHIGALQALTDAIKHISNKTQVILTTQSPDLISLIDTTDLRVVEKKEGNTLIGNLDEAQRASIDEHLFNAGDLVRIDGRLKIQTNE